jgi:dephospho-CoA kinase
MTLHSLFRAINSAVECFVHIEEVTGSNPVSPTIRIKNMIIGLSGTNSSGKDTVAEYLADLGFTIVSLSDILREEMQKRQIKIERESLIETANVLEKEWGKGALAKKAVEEYGQKQKLVISSIRKPAEVDYLKRLEGFRLVFVDAPIEMRFMRVVKRGREGEDKLSFEEFKRQEEIEMSGKSSQRLDYCKEKADIILTNDGTLEELIEKVDAIIENTAKAK